MLFLINRLKDHLTLNKRETMRKLMNRVAPCRALFNIFDTNRHLFCHHIIDPINGLWFSAFTCLILWAILTPISLCLANVYKQMNNSRGFRRSNSHQWVLIHLFTEYFRMHVKSLIISLKIEVLFYSNKKWNFQAKIWFDCLVNDKICEKK